MTLSAKYASEHFNKTVPLVMVRKGDAHYGATLEHPRETTVVWMLCFPLCSALEARGP